MDDLSPLTRSGRPQRQRAKKRRAWEERVGPAPSPVYSMVMFGACASIRAGSSCPLPLRTRERPSTLDTTSCATAIDGQKVSWGFAQTAPASGTFRKRAIPFRRPPLLLPPLCGLPAPAKAQHTPSCSSLNGATSCNLHANSVVQGRMPRCLVMLNTGARALSRQPEAVFALF